MTARRPRLGPAEADPAAQPSPNSRPLQAAFLSGRAIVAAVFFVTLSPTDAAAFEPGGGPPSAPVMVGVQDVDEDPFANLMKDVNALSQRGQYQEAEALIRAMLSETRHSFGEGGFPMTVPERLLADNLVAQGRFEEAEVYYRDIVKIDLRLFGPSHHFLAAAYSNLAGDLDFEGKYDEAYALASAALQIEQKLGREDPALYMSLGNVLNYQGYYYEAQPLYEKALAISQKAFSERDGELSTAYYNVGMNLASQGRFAEAEAIYLKVVDLDAKRLGPQSLELAFDYSDIAYNLTAQGRYGEARPLYQTSLQIYEKAGDQEGSQPAVLYRRMAENLEGLGLHADAEPLFFKALVKDIDTLGPDHPFTARAYVAFGSNLRELGRAGEALDRDEKALEIDQKALGEEHPDTARSYAGVASDLMALNRCDEALPLARKGAEAARRHRSSERGAHSQGVEAVQLRSRAAEVRDDGLSYVFATLMQADLGCVPQGNTAAPHLAEAFLTAQDLASSSAGEAMAQAAARRAAGGALGVLARRQQDLASEVRRLDTQILLVLPKADPAAASRLRSERDQVLAELVKTDGVLQHDFPRYADLISPKPLSLDETQRRLKSGEGVLLIAPAKDDVFTFVVTPDTVQWNRALGSAKTTLDRLMRIRCQMDSVACAGDGTKPGTNLAGSASSSPKTARPTGPEGLGERGRPFDRAAAFGLFHDLIAPVQGALKGVAVLYVVASGPLSSIPLGVLVTAPPSGDGSDDDLATLQRTAWFADAYALITLPTLSSLSNETSDASASNPSSPVAFVGYGDPSLAGAGVAVRGGGRGVFMRSGGEAYSLADPEALRLRLQPLPGTAVELRAMAKALKSDPNALHMGADDTETTLRRDPQLSAARVIAFATHGLLPSDLQGLQEPGLVFTPPKVATEEDDGVLTASEVSQLHLSADWIILSACNTATSDGKPGADSLSSLARAFLYSGARALLASHWRVDDAATAALTVETLSSTQATAGLTRAQALQAAMRSIRTGTRSDGSRIENWTPEWSHPRSWGPFSLISNQDH